MQNKNAVQKLETQISLIVTPELNNQRLDKAIVELCPDLSRARIQSFIKEGLVLLNESKSLKMNVKVHEGDSIKITIPQTVEAQPQPENIPLDIIYEDEDLIVINKPIGLVVHPSPGHASGTLVNALLFHCKESLSGIGGVKRPGIVHRLDKDTSGLMVVAKNDKTHNGLSDQFKSDAKTLKRHYWAWVWNRPSEKEGTITNFIGRSNRDRQKMAVVSEHRGKEAISHYKLEKMWSSKKAANFISQVSFELSTGRTHQIRVHCAEEKMPIFGDKTYGLNREQVRINAYWPQLDKIIDRQALHAYNLSFLHPIKKEEMTFSSPLPSDLRKFLETLKCSG